MWNPFSSILVKTDWQYTEPVTGEYFKLKHTNAPVNSSCLIAQAQVNTDNSVELFDIQELKVTEQLQDICLKSPGIFSDRRIAIKRVTKQPTLESELRRVIRDDLFRDSDYGELSLRRSAWQVDIEVSDYLTPSPTPEPTPDPTPDPTPSTGDQYFNNVVLLMHMNGQSGSTVFTDVKGKTVTPVGGAQISTAQSKFGGASAYFDGSGDYLSVPVSTDFTFGSGDFAWECETCPAIVGANNMAILGNGQGGAPGNAGLFLAVSNSHFIFRHWLNNYSNAVSQQTILADTWYHVAVAKVGTTISIFVDGIKGSDGSTTIDNQDNQFQIGTVLGNAGYATDYQGYLDEIRITKGIARYTTNFTPPTAPFPNN